MSPARTFDDSKLSIPSLRELDEAAKRLLGKDGMPPDVAVPVAALMAAVWQGGDARPERIVNVLVMAAYMLGITAIENMPPAEALSASGQIAEQLGKALAEADLFLARTGGGRA